MSSKHATGEGDELDSCFCSNWWIFWLSNGWSLVCFGAATQNGSSSKFHRVKAWKACVGEVGTNSDFYS